MRPLAGLLAWALLVVACSGAEERESTAPSPADGPRATTAAGDGERGEATPARQRAERPLPAFSGWTLTGEKLEISSLIGKRMLLFFFNPEVETGRVVGDAVASVAKLAGEYNFQVVGIAMAAPPSASRAFAAKRGFDFPVIDDSSARIANRIGLRSPVALLGVDPEGYVIFGQLAFRTDVPNAADVVEDQLRESLRLPPRGEEAAPGARPEAPRFSARVLDQTEPFVLEDSLDRGVVLVFFLHTCPHCHELLEFLKTAMAELPEAHRPRLVGLEVTGRTAAVRSELARQGLDFFTVIFDDDGSIQEQYGVFGGVPDTLLIDRQGRITARMQGFDPSSDGPLLRMRIAKIGGGPVPMLLSQEGYSGDQVCGVCHESEHATWEITRHAHAFATLVKHGADGDPECVSCHVVGFGKHGGFDMTTRPAALENVGCESCHGRGGPHQSPDFVKDGSYESACVGCHDTKHSLGFTYAKFLPEISHAANARILALPEPERREVLAQRGAIRSDLLPANATHVGSEACQSCHPKEFEAWAAGPHAHAVETLVAKGKSGDADCLACHTTATGRKGGFPKGGDVADHPDLARVGCESCHGPGGNHVGEDAEKIGTIVSLGDKCDSCVILKICGGCHDEANDPGFAFEVQAKIDRIRHGTIEAGTGKPLVPGTAAFRSSRDAGPGAAADLAHLAHAFALLDARRAERP